MKIEEVLMKLSEGQSPEVHAVMYSASQLLTLLRRDAIDDSKNHLSYDVRRLGENRLWLMEEFDKEN